MTGQTFDLSGLEVDEAKAITLAHEAIKGLYPERIELVGAWLWVYFQVKPCESDRATLKAAGFKWAPKKELWYFAARPAASSRGRKSMGAIRFKYGSQALELQPEA